ncbi:MAG: diphosphomevalonate decarboxylase [Saprospiraceae bacterium]
MEIPDYNNPKLVLETSSLEPGHVVWRSPSNLAIVKYWGKHGNQLPKNPSLSLTLETAFTMTRIDYKAKESSDTNIELELFFENERNEAFEERVKKYFGSLTEIFPFLKQLSFTVNSANSFPHSSGIASSASAMSALALGLCSIEHELFGTLDDDNAFDQKASYLSRLGSGSASRSIFPGMSVWGKTSEVAGSSDYYAVPFENEVHDNFKNMRDDILIVSSGKKSVSSSAGHNLMDANPFAEPRYQQAVKNMMYLVPAIQKGDWDTFGKIAEQEALTLHALMMSSSQGYILMKPNSIKIMEMVRDYRKETGHPVYFSLDAGPNVHLLYPADIIHEVRSFVESQLVPLCEEGKYIDDYMGEGPVQQ